MVISSTTIYDLLKLIINRSDEKVKSLADSIFEIYTDNISSINNSDIKYCELYIVLCKEVFGSRFNITDNRVDLINLFKRHLTNQIFRKDAYIKDALRALVETELSPERIVDITKKLNNIVSWHTCKNFITKMYGHLKDSTISYSVDDQATSLDNVKCLLDDFKNTLCDINLSTSKDAPVEVIDFSNMESITKSYNLFKQRRVEHVLKTGLQGLNQMAGSAGGIALGESVCFGARSHHFKSSILMKLAHWIPEFSSPPPCQGKKPTILIISLENEGYQNMMKIFKEMYISKTGKLPDFVSDEEVLASIYELFNCHGYTFIIERYLPSAFGYEELVRLHERYESSGFRIIATILDYITLMKTHRYGTASKAGDSALIQSMVNNVVNYFKSVGTTLLTAAQLNREADVIASSGLPHRVKRFSPQHIALSSGIFREFDFFIFQEIEKDEQGRSWLTMYFGKHRYVDDTIEAHKFFAVPLDPIVGLISDMNGPSTCVRNIYAKNSQNKATVENIESILGMIS